MDCFPFVYLINFIFVVLYFVFLYLLFNKSFESIMVICLFFLVILSGYTIIAELISIKGVLDLSKFYELFNDDSGAGALRKIIFSNFTIIVLLVLLIMNIMLYVNGASPLYMIILSVALAGVLSIKFGVFFTTIPYWLAFGIPMVLTMVAFILLVIAIYYISYGKNKHLGSLSGMSSNMGTFKLFAAMELILFVLFFMYFFTFYKNKEGPQRINELLEFSCYLVLPILYVNAAYLVYVAQGITTQTGCI